LNVGNHREHKDIPTLLEAWQSLPQDVSADLYLTGTDDLPPSSARPERASGTLRFLGGLAPERLRALQAGALALVQPSLCEGFGLPLLEAASVGTPILASNEAIPGVLRPYADAFAARDVRGLAILMENIWRNPERREQAQRFARTQTWDRCAEKTAEVYREILKEKTR